MLYLLDCSIAYLDILEYEFNLVRLNNLIISKKEM